MQFLSTLSLRRATRLCYFIYKDSGISIHALLAESDALKLHLAPIAVGFLSTLSLRRATTGRTA